MENILFSVPWEGGGEGVTYCRHEVNLISIINAVLRTALFMFFVWSGHNVAAGQKRERADCEVT